MKHKFVKITARISLVLILILLLICFVSCGSTKTRKSNLQQTKEKETEISSKKKADSIRIKDSLAIFDKSNKIETETTKNETEIKTKVVLTPEKDSVTGKLKPAKYTEKTNGKTTTEITIDGNGTVTVETNKKTTEEKFESKIEKKETSKIKTKDLVSFNNSLELKEKVKEDLTIKEAEEIKKKNNLPFFFTWWFWLLIIIILIILYYFDKRFSIFGKIKTFFNNKI